MALEEFAIDVPPAAVIGWARAAEADPAAGLTVSVSREYRAETDFDREAFGIGEEDDVSLVTVTGVLAIAPSAGGGPWSLEVRVSDTVGMISSGAEADFADDDALTVEAFVDAFLLPEGGEVEIILRAADEATAARVQRDLAGGVRPES